MMKNSCRWRYSKGATLLEVMIAAVILGVGLLGIAALQMTSLQGSSNAEYRGRAADLAWSLAERMRANLPGIASYASAIATKCPAPTAKPAACAMVPGATSTSAVTQCTPAQIAAYDLWEIRCSNGLKKAANVDGGVKGELPGGTMLVTSTTNASGAIANIQINWLTRTTDNSAKTLTDRLSISVMPGTDAGLPGN